MNSLKVLSFKNTLLIILLSLSLQEINGQQIPNCILYNVSNIQLSCQKCLYGYSLDYNKQCIPQTWIQVISSIMIIKYFQPILQFKSIFNDFASEFWFFSVNKSHSEISTKLTQLLITINNQKLWPFKILNYLESLLGDKFMKYSFNFLDITESISKSSASTIKQDLFLMDKVSFQFISTCIKRLLCSIFISLSCYSILKIIQKIIFIFTNYRLLEKRQIKGTFILMATVQFYQFVGFYGFYTIKNFNGFSKFRTKINIVLTIGVIFIYFFLSMCLLPIVYLMNLDNQMDNKNKMSIENEKNELSKVHRALTFANNSEGYFYFVMIRYFKHFFMGSIVGYFYGESYQYILLAIVYIIEYLLLDSISDNLSFKIYFVFRKCFIFTSVVYLLLLFQENMHIFSKVTQSFQQEEQICLCLLYVFSTLQFSLNCMDLICIAVRKIKLMVKNRNKVYNNDFEETQKDQIKRRKLLRQPSIGQKLLNRLKSMKSMNKFFKKSS